MNLLSLKGMQGRGVWEQASGSIKGSRKQSLGVFEQACEQAASRIKRSAKHCALVDLKELWEWFPSGFKRSVRINHCELKGAQETSLLYHRDRKIASLQIKILEYLYTEGTCKGNVSGWETSSQEEPRLKMSPIYVLW